MMAVTTRDVQFALSALGISPGPIDGIFGPRTRAAIMQYQREQGLTANGIAGPLTRAKLLGEAARKPEPAKAVPLDMPWLIEAERLRGTREIGGRSNSPIIMDWAEDMDIAYSGDDVPWCGLFVAHCLRTGLPDTDLPANPLGARQWLSYGETAKPQLGALLVFWRGSPSGWQGHVGFYWAEDDACFHVLGGNQSDAVTVTRIERRRLLGARWPAGRAVPNIIRQASPAGRLISVNEA